MEKLTPEAHHNRLMEEIEYDMAHHGPASLAAIMATMLEDDNRPAEYAAYAPHFRKIETLSYEIERDAKRGTR